MFDLITGRAAHIPGGGSGPVLMSSVLHVLGLGALIVVPLLVVEHVVPRVPTMLAFVATAPPPPPPPAAPAPPRARQAQTTPTPAQVPAPAAAPVEAPPTVAPEPPAAASFELAVPGGVDGGVPGVVGGVVGGVGGIVGGIPADSPPPPPPPPPVAPSGPVRVGGAIKPPALIHRVEPEYPPVAVSANVQGVVILEATVTAEGRVKDVRVVRGVPLLERAAIDAVMQWRYSPVTLNGKAVPFILTVAVQFSMADGRRAY